MCAILLSINPIHVENILNGTKSYEFRKRACKKQVDRILIYSTNPVMKVVGRQRLRRFWLIILRQYGRKQRRNQE